MLKISMYWKSTFTNTIIHFDCNHHVEHKLETYTFCNSLLIAYNCYIITQDTKEINPVINTALNNGYFHIIISELNTNIKAKMQISQPDKHEKKHVLYYQLFNYRNLQLRKLKSY
jgi:hypothetical protein